MPGMLPKYRRLVEELFQRKLLAVCVCTETLAAGINLPARSVVLSIAGEGAVRQGEADRPEHRPTRCSAGPAGRSSTIEGYVYALAHEDDVQAPALETEIRSDSGRHEGPGVAQGQEGTQEEEASRGATRFSIGREGTFEQLKTAPPGKLYSKGPLPWRLLAYLLKLSPEVERIRGGDSQTAAGCAAHRGRREALETDARDAA